MAIGLHFEALFERSALPMLSAIAETGWTIPGNRDYHRFAALAGLMSVPTANTRSSNR